MGVAKPYAALQVLKKVNELVIISKKIRNNRKRKETRGDID